MPLVPGNRLGFYEISALLGSGGMGEVYRARDTRLGRQVALKVLLEEVSQDKKRQARFEQEARSASALTHPNVACIYEIGSDGGILYVGSELIEGESLRTLIARGPVAPATLLQIAIQIAEGVSAAHSVGIVHCDLKPDNILLTPEGRVKIIDFGLAKQIEFREGEAVESGETLLMTEPGVIMGTAAYMSPEQVRAQDADFRSDIFSLGAILYEMASGKRAFPGRSRTEVMHAILKEDPSSPPSAIGRDIDSIIRRCLEKLPERRFQTSKELALALESARDTSKGRRSARPPRVTVVAWAAAALLMTGIAAAIYLEQALTVKVAPKVKGAVWFNPIAPSPLPADAHSSAKAPAVAPPGAAERVQSTPLLSLPPTTALSSGQPATPESAPTISAQRMEVVAKEMATALAEARYPDAMRNLDEGTREGIEPDLQRKWEQKAGAAVVAALPTTLAGLLREFLRQHVDEKLAPKTIERYHEQSAYLAPELLAMPLAKITPLHFNREWARLLKCGGHTRKSKTPRSLSLKTVRNIAGVVSSAFSRAIRWGLATVNPVTMSEPPVPKKHEGMALTPVQQELVFASASGPWCMRTFLEVASVLGCRRGELLALRWSDIVDGRAVITRSLTQTRHGGLQFKGTKTNKPRTLKLLEPAPTSLAAHRLRQNEFKVKFGRTTRPATLSSPTRTGRPFARTLCLLRYRYSSAV